MVTFGGISFNWFIIMIAFIGFIYALRALYGYHSVKTDAAEDYNYKQPQGMIDSRLSKEDYIRLYRRVHNPRSLAYVAVTIFAIFAITPISMFIFEHVYTYIYNVTGQSRVIEPGFLVWQFFIFFFIIGNCTLIAYFMARHYHRRTPGTFQAEMEKAISTKL